MAGELERRWNEKLADDEATKQRLSSLKGSDGRYLRTKRENPIEEEKLAIRQSDRCPAALKKDGSRANQRRLSCSRTDVE